MKSLSLNAAWNEASAFIRREAVLLIPVVLLFIAIPLALIFQAIPPEFREMTPNSDKPMPQLPAASLLLIFAVGLLVFGGVLATNALSLKPGISVREAVVLGFRKLPVAIGSALTVLMLIGLPVLLIRLISPLAGDIVFLLTVLFVSVRLIFLNAVIVDSDAGPVQALQRSWALSRGQVPRLLLFILVITAPVMLVNLIVEMAFALPAMAMWGKEAGMQAGGLGRALAMSLGQMVIIVMTVRMYRQLRPAK